MRRRGLTLVELLVVIAIVAFLSTYLIVTLRGSAIERSHQQATKALIGRVKLALENYRRETGTFPPDFTYLMTSRTRTEVTGDPQDPRNVRTIRFGPLLVVERERISKDGKEILDDWETPLHYDPTRATGIVWSEHVNER